MSIMIALTLAMTPESNIALGCAKIGNAAYNTMMARQEGVPVSTLLTAVHNDPNINRDGRRIMFQIADEAYQYRRLIDQSSKVEFAKAFKDEMILKCWRSVKERMEK